MIVDRPRSIQFCGPISLGLSGRCTWNRYRLLGGHPPNSSWQSFVLLLNGQRSRGPPSSPFLATSQQNKRDPCSGFLCWIDRQNNRPTQNKSQFSHVDDTVKIKWNHLVEEMLKGEVKPASRDKETKGREWALYEDGRRREMKRGEPQSQARDADE